MSRRLCLALDLIDDADLIAGYEAAHAPGAAWPEVTQGIRESGFLSLEIWRAGDRMVMVAEVDDDGPRPLRPELQPIDDRWQAAMARFQKPLPFANRDQKWVPMSRIYSLDEQ